jgi:hypothetical protein
MVIRIGIWNLENLFKPPYPFAPKAEGEYQAQARRTGNRHHAHEPTCVGCAGGRRADDLRRAC